MMFTNFLSVASIHFLALLTPGADFSLVARNSLFVSRRAGVLTSFGLGLGILTHVVLCLLGLGFVIKKNPDLYFAISILGSLFLVYMGSSILLACFGSQKNSQAAPEMQEQPALVSAGGSDLSFVRNAYFTNILNPKVILFFLSLFTNAIAQTNVLIFKIACGVEMFLATVGYFSLVSIMLSNHRFKDKIQKFQNKIEPFFGVVILLFGLLLFLNAVHHY